jgi:hypothetical protein
MAGFRSVFLFVPRRNERRGRILFHYTFGMVRVKGNHLDYIYSMVRGHELGSINCTMDETANPDDPLIREIVFEKSEDAQ